MPRRCAAAKGHTRLSLEKKHSIVQELESNTVRTKTDIARQYGVQRPSINYCWLKRDKIKAAFAKNPEKAGKLFSFKGPEKGKTLDSVLLQWFEGQRAANKEINTFVLLNEAKKAAATLGVSVDSIDPSWLQRWRQRHGITAVMLSGEKGSAPDVSEWISENRDLLNSYARHDIMNYDESALFWRATSRRTFLAATEDKRQVRGPKAHKCRITTLMGCTASGDLLDLIVVGQSAKPRWPTRPGQKKLTKPPVKYLSAKKGWMTRDLFSSILSDLEAKCRRQKKKKLLLLDNCPAHRGFESVYDGDKTLLKVLMLPKNATSVVQPVDLGLARSVKCAYRRRLALAIQTKPVEKVTLFEALQLLNLAWKKDVTSSVVLNSWRKTGLLEEADNTSSSDGDSSDTSDGSDGMVSLEDNEQISEEPQCEAAETVAQKELDKGAESDSAPSEASKSQSSLASTPRPPPPTVTQCVDMLDRIQDRFLLSTGEVPVELSEVRLQLNAIPQRQSRMTDFFRSATVTASDDRFFASSSLL